MNNFSEYLTRKDDNISTYNNIKKKCILSFLNLTLYFPKKFEFILIPSLSYLKSIFLLYLQISKFTWMNDNIRIYNKGKSRFETLISLWGGLK